jgi:surface protein
MTAMFWGATLFNNSGEVENYSNHMNWIVTQFVATPINFSLESNLTLGPIGNSPFTTSGISLFIYTFDFIGTEPTDVSNNLPIINTNGSFTTLNSSYNVVDNKMEVTIAFVYSDSEQNDGLSFKNVSTYYNAFTNLTITQFGEIPLSKEGEQFAQLSSLIFTATDAPTILTNTSLYTTFAGCATFDSNISGWNTFNVINMRFTFLNATNFNQDIGNWNTSSVADMGSMFQGATNFNKNISYDNVNEYWDTSSVADMGSMFQGATSFNEDIRNWNTSLVANMNGMFSYATSFNQDIGTWDTSNVIDMGFMFSQATSFNKYIGNWDTSNVINMSGMFSDATSFNQDIGNWDTSNVIDMNSMFQYATSFDKNIGNWDTSAVTDMSSIFSNATSFNQDIGNWDTSAVTDMSSIFSNATSFNQYIGNWYTSAVTDMSFMFAYATNFNQNIGNWNTSEVTRMGCMFFRATSFNQDIGNWKTSKVTDMLAMFSEATSFNQKISYDAENGYWDTSKVISMDSMFEGATLFNNSGVVGDESNHMNWIVTQFDRITPIKFSYQTNLTLQPTGNSPFYTDGTSQLFCLLEGTKILALVNNTATYVPIETLRKGDLVKTTMDGFKAIHTICYSTINNPGHDQRIKDRLYKCSREKYPELIEDLVLTGCHSILVNELTDKQREETIKCAERIFATDERYRLFAFLDDKTEPYTQAGQHTIWHLALETDNCYRNYGVFANGLLVETASISVLNEKNSTMTHV